MISPKHKQILRHALGLDRQKDIYRNHFVTGPGSQDYLLCEDLVAAGLMKCRAGNELTGGDSVFFVTDQGRAVAKENA